MGRYNIHGGHNKIVPGASKIIDEVTEDRKVKNALIELLDDAGHTVYDCTDDSGRTSGANLANIVAKCNKHSVDLDVSIHLNSGRGDTKGDGSTGGVEVFCYDSKTKDVAKKIADAIAAEFGYNKRSDSTTPSGYAGVKYSKGLYVLRNTKSKAILVECCFVDDKDDTKVWNTEKCAAAIYKGITGKTASTGSGSSKPDTSKPATSSKSYKVKISTPSGVNMRSGAGKKYGILKAIPNGKTVTISKTSGDWGYTSYDGKKGWICLSYTKKATSSSSSSSSSKFNKSDWVRRLQKECNAQGFSDQTVDGKEGPNTLAGCPLVKEGASGGITKLIQEYLIAHGYSCGSAGADGKFGSGTAAAVRAYQKDHGLSADGDVGPKTWASFLGL